MKVSPARAAAFDILFRIETERAFSSTLLPTYEEKLSPADRGLTHDIVLGVLRRAIYLDRLIDVFANGKKLDTEVRIALRMGLYQLYFLERIPAYSAISESVELVRHAKKSSAAGFVNAILRRATRGRPELKFSDEIDRISVGTSHPRWLVERLAEQFDLERAASIAQANNEIPRVAFRVINGGEGEWTTSNLVDGTYVVNRIDDRLRELQSQNTIYFQEEGSQMIAAAVDVPNGGSFLDVCAAPGGKTGMIELRNSHAKFVVAGDLHTKRVEFLKENCQKQGATSVNIVQYDATKELPFADESFDSILLDAPCSGTGTIRHNPEIRYFLQPDDIAELSHKQQLMLQNASKLVKKGGTLVYSTCSLEPEENEVVVNEFLAQNAEFEKLSPNVPERFITTDGFARTWPDRDSIDGFFVAVVRLL